MRQNNTRANAGHADLRGCGSRRQPCRQVKNQSAIGRVASGLSLALFGLGVVAGAAVPQAAPSAVTVNLNVSYQTMDNFGASDCWSMQKVGAWSETNKNLIADLLFGTNQGIGLTCWRFNLGAGVDTNRITDPWRTVESFETAQESYDWSRQGDERWFLRAAKTRGVTQFVAFVNSPPLRMTRNGYPNCTEGLGTSNLRPGSEGQFAKYLADVLHHFHTNTDAAERVTFTQISPFNEPYWEWNDSGQEGNRASNGDMTNVVHRLAALLAARGLPTQIQLAEAGDPPGLYQTRSDISGKYGATYGDYVDAFAAPAGGVANLISRALCGHSYWADDVATQLVQRRQSLRNKVNEYPGWKYWMTEYCILGDAGPGRDWTVTTPLQVGRVIHADLTVAHASAWHWWLALSRYDYKDGLLYTSYVNPGDSETLYAAKTFWALGHFSRFIRPGMIRVDLAGANDYTNFLGSAFADSARSNVVVVLLNLAITAREVAFTFSGIPLGRKLWYLQPYLTSDFPQDNLNPLPLLAPTNTLTLPARSLVTLVGRLAPDSFAGSPPVISALANRTIPEDTTATLTFSLSDAETPAPVLTLAAVSSNPSLAPATNLVFGGGGWVTGRVSRDFYADISNDQMYRLTRAPRFPHQPTSRDTPSSFEAPSNIGDHCGQRLRGYLTAPLTGAYTFWIASDDQSELHLSTDENPVHKVRIAAVTNWTNPREWTKEAGQQSAPIPLVAGCRYYVEAVHKEGWNSDHLAVGWALPGGALERPIPGTRLSPYTNESLRTLTVRPATNQFGAAVISVIATDADGARATNSFTLTVNPVNDRPVLAPLANRTNHAATTIVANASATDPDPADVLAFSLVSGPAGLSVSPAGEIRWVPAENQIGTHLVTLRVADNATPSLSATQSFAITVAPPLKVESFQISGGEPTVRFRGIPGSAYTLEAATNLLTPPELTLWTVVTNATASSEGEVELRDSRRAVSRGRFYRLRCLGSHLNI